LIFTNAVKRMGVRDSGRSRVPPGDGDRFAAKATLNKYTDRRVDAL